MKQDKNFIIVCQKLGNSIRNKREQKQISIKEMSTLTGIRTEYLRKIEFGTAYGIMFEKHLLKIANAMHLKLFELFDF